MFLICASFLQILKYIGYFLVALICLMLMIMVHEFGHYCAGKIFKFKIEEFSIGFGPKIFSKTNKETGEVFALRWVPLGGFCQFAGEDEDVKSEGDFNSKPWWQRIIVLLSGVLFNYIFAIIFLSIFFMGYGEVNRSVAKVHTFADTSIVQNFKEGDVILKINGKNAYASIPYKFNDLWKDEHIIVTVDRQGEIVNFEMDKSLVKKTEIDENGIEKDASYHGFGCELSTEINLNKLSFFDAIGHSFVFGYDVIDMSVRAIGSVFTGSAKVSETMGGTVTAISMLAMLTESGFWAILYGLGVFSVSLAFMNVLPIPALDGSRVVFVLIEAIRGKPVSRKVEGIIHTVGLFSLFALAIILDLIHFLG